MYNSTPSPSGQIGKQKRLSLAQTNKLTSQRYDEANASLPEVIARKRSQELELQMVEKDHQMKQSKKTINKLKQENTNLKQEFQDLWKSKDELHLQLDKTQHELAVMGKQNFEMNKTIQDFQLGINDSFFADQTQTEMLKIRADSEHFRMEMNHYKSLLDCATAEYDQSCLESQEKLKKLTLEKDHALRLLAESDSAIQEKMSLDKTISEEKMKYLLLKEKYEENERKIEEARNEQAMQLADYRENCLKMSYYKKLAEEKEKELAMVSEHLNNEKKTNRKIVRKNSVKMKVLTKKNQKSEAKVQNLERELAASRNENQEKERDFERAMAESRMEMRRHEEFLLEERKKRSVAFKVGKVLCLR